jgi:hypothetical protein
MSLGIVRNVVRLVVLIMAFECISSALSPIQKQDGVQTTSFKKPSSASVLASIFFEKAEEERSEEENDHLLPVLLADFSCIAFQLSNVHSVYVPYTPLQQRFNKQPSLFKLFCSFLI